AAPGPVLRETTKVRLDRVHCDVGHRRPELWVGLDALRPITSLKQVPRTVVSPVETARVRAVQPPHAVTEVGPRSHDEEMDVVVHEAVSEKTPTTILGRAPQRAQIRTAVDVVAEDHALVVAARINVEDASL